MGEKRGKRNRSGAGKSGPDPFRSRIVGEGEEAPDQILANPANWRRHPKEQIDALEGVLESVGWVQRVIVNRTTGNMVDGHARVELALRRSEPTVPVLYVELSEAEERVVLATIDPIGGLASADEDMLAALLAETSSEDPRVQALLDSLAPADEEENPYTTTIKAPTYEPGDERPEVGELFDDSKTRELRAEIDRAEGIPEEVRRFLRLAADRHTVFHFGKIADFYAHAPEEIQDLMEASALVIIDFEKAIAGGFVELVGQLQAQAGEDDGGASDE